MSIITVFELSSMTIEKYSQVIRGLEAAGQGSPEGRLYHIASPQEDGSFMVTAVWESAVSVVERKRFELATTSSNGPDILD